MRSLGVVFCLFSLTAFAQSDRGTMTGTVSDATVRSFQESMSSQ